MTVRHLVERLAWVARFASLVQQHTRFAAVELTGRRLVRWYVPRGARSRIAIRHASGDLFILEELFGDRLYAPPPEVVDALADCGSPRILDLGGHIGLFGVYALERWPGSTLTSYEPDAANFALLDRTRRANAFEGRWTVHPACAGAADGELVFAAIGDSVSHVAASGEPGLVVPQDDVVPLLLASDLVKLDVEGAEWPILEDVRFDGSAGPHALVLEYHAESGAMDVAAARSRAHAGLAAKGYAIRDLFLQSQESGMLWAWRAPYEDHL